MSIPVTVVTGFLGSGKTTLLSRVLRGPSLRNTAVLVNEFGEVGLDHLLRPVAERMVLLESGCVCCSEREDLVAVLRELVDLYQRGEVPELDRVVIETTGLADPAPILYTVFSNPVLQHHFAVDLVITTVDAVNGGLHLSTSSESVKQVASADKVVITKTDLAGPEYTRSQEAIRRYAYTPEYRNTLDYFIRELEALGFECSEDPVGNLVARNRPPGEKVFGIGSHCDSNRNGGKYDGTMGVAAAVEVCRLNEKLGLDLPLQVISFLEEEGSGFGQMVLGSRIVARRVGEEELKSFRAIDDGRTFFEHAREAGYEPERWRECARILDDLAAWIELHIEQARVLQDTHNRIGIVEAIAGYVHADITVYGRSDHAGATPMGFRRDIGLVMAECMLELERLATEAGKGTVGTVGEVELEPNLINAVPGKARFSLDIRGVDEEGFRGVARDIASFAREAAERRGTSAEYRERQSLPVTPLDEQVVGALEEAAKASGEPYMPMPSGAAHDTMCVAERVPSAMVFVPCEEGISHSPEEKADPADAALGAEIMLDAIRKPATG